MTYFTKDCYYNTILANAYRYVRKCDGAEQNSEEFYKKCYDKRLAVFIRNEKMNDLFIDPAEELRKVDEYVNESNITDEERAERESIRKGYIAVNKKRLESGKFYKFDRDLSVLVFEARQKRLIEIYGKLPENILAKIADMRVFALGYATAEVKELLHPYCIKLHKECEEIMQKALSETADAEKHLNGAVEFRDLREVYFYGIKQTGKDILAKTEIGNFIFVNGKIMEGQCKPIYPHNSDKPYCPFSLIYAAELHCLEETFKAQFLIANFDETENRDLWYLTIECTDIQKNAL